MASHKKDIPSKRDKEREKAEKERAAAAVTERLKIVVRRLPPTLPEDIFWQSVQQWVTDQTISWKAFFPGKSKKKLNKENIPSRAYIAFKSEDILAQFNKEYDGHIFRDKQGNEFQAVVEFAPYQKVPPEKKKVDTRNATIEKDEDYISFVASLAQPVNTEPISIEALVAANQPPPMPKTTPLLEALKAEKLGHKEAMLRNQALYKDATILTAPSIPRNLSTAASAKDDLPKKKTPPHPKEASQAESSKKGKKAQAAAAKQPQPPQSIAAPKKEPPPFKPHKVARQQAAAAKAIAAASQRPVQPASETVPAEAPAPLAASTSGEGSGSGVAAHVSAAAAASRRGRPIVGLASRQLQAALSQVGASAVERKKREREAERIASPIGGAGLATDDKGKEPERATNVISPIPHEINTNEGRDKERPKQTSPSSPRRDRVKKKEKNTHPPDKIPSILQRPDGVPALALQRDNPAQILPSVTAQSQSTASGSTTADAPPRGGGPRRGRYRGRGGPPQRGS